MKEVISLLIQHFFSNCYIKIKIKDISLVITSAVGVGSELSQPHELLSVRKLIIK